ncbi:gamma-glutamyltransferase [Saccharopolyspora karakumensis]|uniref:Glutathione hydrolase proenzyme n=1 Tax=Saccharopolyspora karakumensis TaxID=2530386 RepID=A0A4R5B1G5_9PSEU|nr:gamma-glutamyltransferase [Saccharopolyspora karakumensis]TDD79898.1 gamma-glutamyltransferase [Saccharopolyspora karakumensis]
MRSSVRVGLSVLGVCALVTPVAQAAPEPPKQAEAVGFGGAVSSVDPDATRAGLDVLRRGGTAADAAVATAAALGVTEPYSAGIGGGGFFVHYDSATGEVDTIDGRETAPASAREDLFLENGEPIPFDEAVTSGLGVGVPGTPRTWERALERWGSKDLGEVLRPAERLARDGFAVDETFRSQTADNQERFSAFPATRELFLPGGQPPAVGSVHRNPDLADTYRRLGDEGAKALHSGDIGADIVSTVTQPPVDPAAGLKVRPGAMTASDLEDYQVIDREPTQSDYRGYDVYGMAPSGSGGTTVGEALNILERGDLAAADKTGYLHRYLEAGKLGFADRNRWVGDPAFSEVPTEGLLSDEFAASRECLISDDAVLPAPVAPGDPASPQGCEGGRGGGEPYEGPNTTHLTVADASGDIVSYTLTIEQTGGSGIVVPGRGFLLNNELTDFSFTPVTPGVPDPNLPGPGKRPRSSMSPTIVLQDGKPVLAVGSPGGSTIITTVLQTLTGRLDRGQSLAEAIAEPRASQRNSATTDAEPGFLAQPEAAKLEALGHRFESTDEIGAATGVELLPDGRWVAAAEPHRRGGGSAAVVIPTP